MLVPLFPKVAGIKSESSWGHGKKGIVRCLARLTRPLTKRQAERLASLLPLNEAIGDRVVGYCLLSEVEEWRESLERNLILAARPAPRPARGEKMPVGLLGTMR